MYKLLIVDDEEKIRKLISKYAIFEGYDVVEAEDGMKATELMRYKDFDLVILDIMLPDIDGFTVCRQHNNRRFLGLSELSANSKAVNIR